MITLDHMLITFNGKIDRVSIGCFREQFYKALRKSLVITAKPF